MLTKIDDLITQFETVDINKKDFTNHQQVNSLINKILQQNSYEIVPYLLEYIRNKRYLTNNITIDFRFIHILKIFEHFKDPNCVPELVKLTNEPKLSHYIKDICNCIGQIKSELSRNFLRKQLENTKLGELCAILLAYFPDPSGENILIDNFKDRLKQGNFSIKIFHALVHIRNNKVWNLLEDYIETAISEKERYKICENLLKLNDSLIIPFLINFYLYYTKNTKINYQQAKSISLEDESLILTKVYKESIPFSEKMKKRILNKLILYHSDFRVKALLRKASQ